ncbi:uncharacterized protein LOC122718078 [Apis laboriosa]|uniref:uncharacterized protein LOC122718078 n=1 Tax=Apis laboriosa TaxID=183418 RepID=UPI001CC74037|nr:uncharacterized protein LOC122718078 [Apis laboriosa]
MQDPQTERKEAFFYYICCGPEASVKQEIQGVFTNKAGSGKEEERKYFENTMARTRKDRRWRNDRRRKYYGGNGRRERKNEGIEWAEVARTGRLQPPWLPPH